MTSSVVLGGYYNSIICPRNHIPRPAAIIPLDDRRRPQPRTPPHLQKKCSIISRDTSSIRSQQSTWISAASAAFSGTSMNDDLEAITNDDATHHVTIPSRISPWLRLPPSSLNQNMSKVNKFYSLKDDKVINVSVHDKRSSDIIVDEPAQDSELVGSSHGWLALYNPRNMDLFLSNPISGRHIRLPSIYQKGLVSYGEHGAVQSVILCSSPDENQDDCRAVMIYGYRERRLAFCYPGQLQQQWTPISTHYNVGVASCVYSSTQNLFFLVNNFLLVEGLDIGRGRPPKCFPISHPDDPRPYNYDENNFFWPPSSTSQWDWLVHRYLCEKIKFLVVVPPDDHHNLHINNSTAEEPDLLLVTQHTLVETYPDGSSCIKTLTLFDNYHGVKPSYDANGMRYPYKTIDFTVHKYDTKEKQFKYVDDGSLDGLAIFVGANHSFALRATDFPELKPDSIYFTDVFHGHPDVNDDSDKCNYGGHDIGIYNYKDKTFSPCYYPCDLQSIKRIEPPPIWYTPTNLP